jgi:hypothetical protein
MLIYLDDFRKARTGMARNQLGEARLKNGTDGADVIDGSHNSAMLYALNAPAQGSLSPELPEDLSTIDIDSFMHRIYALASQV